MKLILLVACLLAVPPHAHAQMFTIVDAPPAVPGAFSRPGPRPTAGAICHLDASALEGVLLGAPLENLGAPLSAYGLAIDLPNPAGGFTPCRVARSAVMEPALAEKFPGMVTLIVEAADRSASGRMELTQRGLTAMLRGVGGGVGVGTESVWMMDPWQSGDADHVLSYHFADLPGGGDWVCHTTEGVHGVGSTDASVYTPRVLQTRKNFRMAMACTGEYGLYHSQLAGHAPNIADPLAAIVTVVSRSNVVYEADLAVHFNLVANNDQIIFIDPDTDPYASTCGGNGGSDCSGDHLGVNRTVLSSVIGNANFDIGHVVTRIFGGVASLSSVCGNNKAQGVSGIPRGGDVDPFSALVVIHEVGHQFGANHTFSGTRGRCEGNVHLSTAWEAGSGSSPMAYAGGCPVGSAPPSDNVVEFADPFFHSGSYGEMQNFIGTISCYAGVATTNNIPTIAAITPATAIPPSTPFVLSAQGDDADNEPLTYSWEQYDAGVARPLTGEGSEDSGAGALFRIFPPVASGARTFPQIADVLSGVPTPGEQLPTVTGVTRRFRVLIRDNHPGAGGVVRSSLVNVAIPSGTSAFAVTSPSGSAVVRSGAATVLWTVGGTNNPPISCGSVAIRLSMDDGITFPFDLGTFPNTGSAVVTLPEATATARVRIDPVDRIFLAISRPFHLAPPCNADYNNDGDVGTDADIEAFFACLAGACCPTCPPNADYNSDGDVGTDQDIEAFFRVLAGGAC